jgi:prepilin-type N-terminal cleavage/methylation domain-containing protein
LEFDIWISVEKMMVKKKKVGPSSKPGEAFQGRSPGFTLIEVLIALALFAIIAIVFAGGLATASRAVLIADVRTRAESLARTQMEAVKNPSCDYVEAPDGGVGNYYAKISIPQGYSICSLNLTTGIAVKCDPTDPVLGWPWDSEANKPVDVDNGLQKITLVIEHDGSEVITLEGYKVDRE